VTQIVYYVAASLDGYIATPDGKVEWLAPFEGSAEDYGYSAFLTSVDVLFMGSRTYEQLLTFGPWPYADKATWVFSRRSLEPVAGVIVTDATPAAVAAEVDAGGSNRAWLVGGATLAGSFRAEGLITEYVVSVMPVILGAGIPLLAASGPAERLRLVDSTSFPSGVIQARYVRR
jgi:dihydrofolate reductase